MIQISGLKKKFGDQTVLDGVTVRIHKGEVVAVLGSSGSGKSTLLRCLNQLETPCDGTIEFSEQVRLGMVFQSFNLFPHMSVLENLVYAPIHVLKMSREQAVENAQKRLAQVGLSAKVNAMPQNLSGGEKQRIAIARTLMMDPNIILFDEPTSALDAGVANEVLKVIRTLAATGITILIVTHEMAFVKEVSDRVLYISQGKIEKDCSTEEYFA